MFVEDYIKEIKQKPRIMLNVRDLKADLLKSHKKAAYREFKRYTEDWVIATLYFLYKHNGDYMNKEKLIEFLNQILREFDCQGTIASCFPPHRQNKVKDLLKNKKERRNLLRIIKASVSATYQSLDKFKQNKKSESE